MDLTADSTMGCMLGNELLGYSFVAEVVRNIILGRDFSEELIQLFKFSSSSREVGTIVAPYKGWKATPSDKPFQASNEGFGGEVCD